MGIWNSDRVVSPYGNIFYAASAADIDSACFCSNPLAQGGRVSPSLLCDLCSYQAAVFAPRVTASVTHPKMYFVV